MEVKQEEPDPIEDYKIDIEEHVFPIKDVWNNQTSNTVKNECVSIKREEEVYLGTDHLEQISIGSKSKIDQLVVDGVSEKCDFIKIEYFEQSEKDGKFNVKRETNSLDGSVICSTDGEGFNADLRNEVIQGLKEEPKDTERSAISVQYVDNLQPCMNEIIRKEQKTDFGENSLECRTQGKPFKCDTCSKSFSHKSHFNRHLRTHTGYKPFKCDICLKCFPDKYQLKLHSHSHTDEKPFKCDTCSKSFLQKGHFNRHLRTHTGEKPFKCDICLKCFPNKYLLKLHLRCHTGEKPFVCEICSKCFSRKYSLKKHLRCHTEEKPYECETCSKCFNERRNLIDHMRIHTGEKIFRCEICSKSFSQKGTLNRHLRSHTGEKPFKCEICLKSFSKLTYLMNHMCIDPGQNGSDVKFG